MLLAELPQFDSMYLIIGVIALILLIVLKTVKKAIRIILGIVAAAALLVWLSSKFGIELPFELPFL
ncbi:MAG: hypothetical protein K6E36_05840 [Oscillospiraceae bacterium]|nr:hypothetical protein [Oscillospiraceae bacterium]MCR5306002.1 hypothetical protein [Oscillospiraceae bacterium]